MKTFMKRSAIFQNLQNEFWNLQMLLLKMRFAFDAFVGTCRSIACHRWIHHWNLLSKFDTDTVKPQENSIIIYDAKTLLNLYQALIPQQPNLLHLNGIFYVYKSK